MILVDTSVWVDHLNVTDDSLTRLLEEGQVLAHPFVIGELAIGTLRSRGRILSDLGDLPVANVAEDDEVMELIEQHRLYGRGIGYIDAHLIAAALLTAGTSLWTRDTRLHSVAQTLRLAADPRSFSRLQ